MGFLQAQLVSTLYRSSCPDSLELGEYQLGLLDKTRAGQVRSHLRQCPRCLEEVARFQAFTESLAEDIEVPFEVRVKTWVARLVPNLPGSGLLAGNLLSAHGLRGDLGQVLMYQAGEAQLSLYVQQDPLRQESRSILGLLIGAPPEEAQVCLFRGGKRLKMEPLDDFGNFILSGVQKGQYDLLLRGLTFEIDVSSLDIE